MKPVHRALLVLAAIVASFALNLNAGVKINGTGPIYATIQAAVNAAVNGDKLHVATGLYVENIVITNRQLTIQGGYLADFVTQVNIPALTTVRPAANGMSIVSIENQSVVTLGSLQITSGVSLVAGGVLVEMGCVVTAQSCVIGFNRANRGGGVGISFNATFVAIDTVISNNTANFGGGVGVASNATFVAINTAIDKNTATIGGGIDASPTARIIMFGAGSECSYNYAYDSGGGIAASAATTLVRDGVRIVGNFAVQRGAGIYLQDQAYLALEGTNILLGGFFFFGNFVTGMTGRGGGIYAADSAVVISGQNCVVGNNMAMQHGGGAFLTNSSMIVRDGAGFGSVLQMNRAVNGDGGGIYLFNSALLLTNNVTVCNGGAAQNGGGIAAYGSDVKLYDNVLVGTTNAGLINSATMGGGLFAIESTAQLINTRIVGNHAINGGGMRTMLDRATRLTGCTVSENVATNGGGFMLDMPDGEWVLDNCAVISNRSSFYGGGAMLFSLQSIVISNATRIADNIADMAGGGLFINGAGTVVVENSRLDSNWAGSSGGGIATWSSLALHCTDTDIINNRADLNSAGDGVGGGISLMSGKLVIRALTRSCAITNNTAVNGGACDVQYYAHVLLEGTGTNRLLLADNIALTNGGALLQNLGCTSLISGNVVFERNRALLGGGIYNGSNSYMAAQSAGSVAPAFYRNMANVAGGALFAGGIGSHVDFEGVRVGAIGAGNVSGDRPNNGFGGGIISLGGASVRAIDCTIEGNICSNRGGGLLADSNSAITLDSRTSAPGVIPGSRVVGNYSGGIGGGVANYGGSLTIHSTFIVSNVAKAGGGVMFSISSGAVVNTIIAHNQARDMGDGIGVYFLPIDIQHCTIAENNRTGVYAAVFGPTPLLLQNSIVWGHTDEQVSTNALAQFCDIEGGFPGPFNLNTNPLFVAASALNFDLDGNSPCIDKGQTLLSVTNDCLLNPRPYGVSWDIGAYEYIPEPSVFIMAGLITILGMRRKS